MTLTGHDLKYHCDICDVEWRSPAGDTVPCWMCGGTGELGEWRYADGRIVASNSATWNASVDGEAAA